MTIDEAIVHAREVAECREDMCEECRAEHEQLAEWLEELKAYQQLDLEIPQHFTKEQSMWIKKYCIERNKEFYKQAVDDFAINIIGHFHFVTSEEEYIWKLAEQLKGGVENDD